ncbi:hypothetical protein [Neolewinella antarctica]|uniref:Uncharacterized protein n=1 Tax=Neolewinella antarctica TaxID=442734 RepID=A0ABX0XBB4_9BACT|nr:hypothetical protein [Neolewinella antarctica]NJC26561.1 hypothetical protein [Neolewinella antarctica]
MRVSILLAFLAVFGLTGCQEDLANAPAYVLIGGIEIVTPDLGGSTSAVSEVWAFNGNDFIGAYPLPARIPVFSIGAAELRFQAGVRRNGISATPDVYEFYAPIERQVDLAAEQVLDLGTLTTGYRTDVKFGFIENFEDNRDRVFVTQLEGQNQLLPTTEFVRSGAFSGKLTVDADSRVVEIASNEQLRDLFTNRPYVWLEVDFRSDAPVAWGVTGQQNGVTFKRFDPTSAPRDEWTKIYFDLSELIAVANLDELEIYLSSVLLGDNERAEIYLDNVRLLYF